MQSSIRTSKRAGILSILKVNLLSSFNEIIGFYLKEARHTTQNLISKSVVLTVSTFFKRKNVEVLPRIEGSKDRLILEDDLETTRTLYPVTRRPVPADVVRLGYSVTSGLW